MNVQDTKALLPVGGLVHSPVEFLFGVDDETTACADHIGEATVVEGPNVVVRTVLHVSLRAVTPVVEQNDDRVKVIARDRGKFETGHLKRAVTDEDEWATFGIGHLRANSCRQRKAHRGIIGRTKKLGALADEQIDRAEKRLADIHYHHSFGGNVGIQPLEKPFDRQWAGVRDKTAEFG